jgi:hypothetical protein
MKHYGFTFEGLIHDHNSIIADGLTNLSHEEHFAELGRRYHDRTLAELRELAAKGFGELSEKPDGT